MDAGYQMTVFNRTLSKCESLQNKGASIASSPRQVAEASDIIFTIVGYPKDVRSTILDEGSGILSGCGPNKVIVDMTTSSPDLAAEIADVCAASSVSCLDAPVSGGDIGAKKGALSIMVGGDTSTFERVLPLFEIMGSNIKHLGEEVGSGQHTKMVNQILIASNMVGVCEGLLYAHRAGLDPERVLSSVAPGAAGSWSLDNLAPRVLRGDFAPGFLVDHFVKDMGIALREAEGMGLELPGLGLARDLYEELQAQGGGRRGTQALALALASLSKLDWPAVLESGA